MDSFIQILLEKYVFANLIKSAWDSIWNSVISPSSDLYASLCMVGVAIALVSLGIFMTRWAREMMDGEVTRPLNEMLWPLLVVTLLAGNGTMLSQLTLNLRGLINAANTLVLDNSLDLSTIGSIKLLEIFQQVSSIQATQVQNGSLIEACNSAVTSRDSSGQCHQSAVEQSKSVVEGYSNLYSSGNNTAASQTISSSWQDAQVKSLNDLAERTKDTGTEKGTTGKTNDRQIPAQDVGIFTTLLNNQAAFQQAIEMAMLLVAALGPLALGITLLVPGGKPLISWITVFMGIGVVKLTYSIVLCLVAAVILETAILSQFINLFTPWFPFYQGIFAPALSLFAGFFTKSMLQSILTTAVQSTVRLN